MASDWSVQMSVCTDLKQTDAGFVAAEEGI